MEWAPMVAISGFAIALVFMAGVILFEDVRTDHDEKDDQSDKNTQ